MAVQHARFGGMPGGGPEGTGFEPAGGRSPPRGGAVGFIGVSAVSCEEVGRRRGHDRGATNHGLIEVGFTISAVNGVRILADFVGGPRIRE